MHELPLMHSRCSLRALTRLVSVCRRFPESVLTASWPLAPGTDGMERADPISGACGPPPPPSDWKIESCDMLSRDCSGGESRLDDLSGGTGRQRQRKKLNCCLWVGT